MLGGDKCGDSLALADLSGFRGGRGAGSSF